VTGEGDARTGRLGPLVQFALIAGPLLSMLDSSIVNVASVPMARALHTGLGSVQWTVSGYLLALGAGLAAAPSLARRFGTLAVYRTGIAGFTAASAACAFAPGISFLIAARAVQGLVAAPLVPLAMSMLLGRGGARRAMSPAAGMLLFLGPALGPTVGGLLIGANLLGAGDGWRLVFLINLPVGAAAYAASLRVPARLAPGRSTGGARFDLPGLAVLATGLTALLLGASQGASDGWGSASALVPLVIGLVLAAAYVARSRRVQQPALDLTLVRDPAAALALALCAAASVVTFAALFLLPAFLQQGQGHSALVTGLAMAPQGLLTGVGMALESRLRHRLDVRRTVSAGFVVLGAASLGMLGIGATTCQAATAALLACRSVSIGLIINPLLTVLTGGLAEHRLSDANTLFSICQRLAGSFGIGLLAALYTTRAAQHGPVEALHAAGLALAAVSALGLVGAVSLRSAPAGQGATGSPAAGAA
jgi:EmrB/QacA subfamily drug resistance transporter